MHTFVSSSLPTSRHLVGLLNQAVAMFSSSYADEPDSSHQATHCVVSFEDSHHHGGSFFSILSMMVNRVLQPFL